MTRPLTLPKDIVDGEVKRPQDVGAERLATCQGLRTAIARTVWLRVLRHRCLLDLDEPYLRNPRLGIAGNFLVAVILEDVSATSTTNKTSSGKGRACA